MNRELESRQITETRSLLQKAGQRNAPQEIVSKTNFSLYYCQKNSISSK